MITLKNKIIFYRLTILLIVLFKIIASASTGLFEDEAIYWNWSQSVDPSYSLTTIAAIGIFTSLFNSSDEIIIRFPALISNLFLILILYKICFLMNIKKEKIYLTIIFFLSVPFISIYSTFISPDSFLLLFSMISVYYFLRIIKFDSVSDWILCGLFMGLMIMSKYNAVVFIFAGISSLVLVQKKFDRKILYLLASLIITIQPLLIWNIIYEPVWLKYYLLSDVDKVSESLVQKSATFLMSQISLLMPAGFLMILLTAKNFFIVKNKTSQFKFLLYLSICLGLIFICFSLSGKIKGNWFFVMYIPIIITFCLFNLNKFVKAVLTIMVIFNFTLLFTLFLPTDKIELLSENVFGKYIDNTYKHYWPDYLSNANNDKSWTERIVKMKNWKETISTIEYEIKCTKLEYDFLATDDYNLSPLLEYYFDREGDVYVVGDLKFKYINSAEAFSKLNGKDAIMVTYSNSSEDEFRNKFEFIENIKSVKVKMSDNIYKEFNIVFCRNFLPSVSSNLRYRKFE
ncbi:MAG: glycosyltransferase family 39 protein [Bacteroidota bacterium]|nr:glycosyltransferase family 39 protein [Bacteroidota bacterium]